MAQIRMFAQRQYGPLNVWQWLLVGAVAWFIFARK